MQAKIFIGLHGSGKITMKYQNISDKNIEMIQKKKTNSIQGSEHSLLSSLKCSATNYL